jgi:hypothetical protein
VEATEIVSTTAMSVSERRMWSTANSGAVFAAAAKVLAREDRLG